MKLASLATCLAVLILAPSAEAGRRFVENVTIVLNPGNSGSAVGAIGSVHNSPDADQFIQCASIASQFGAFGFCQAHDVSGRDVTCSTTDPALVAVIQSVGTDSRVSFEFEASSCTSVLVFNGSTFERKR